MIPKRQLAVDVLTMALHGDMPDTYWLTDQRIQRACEALKIEPRFAQQYAEEAITDPDDTE